MELILKTNNENSIAKIIELAKKLNVTKLNVTIEQRDRIIVDKKEKEDVKNRILSFKAKGPSSFDDTTDWQRNERNDRAIFV